jgi:hypothetical protein
MRSLTPLLSTQPDADSTETNSGQNKKSKKRRRNYEGDEVFRLSKSVICSSLAEGEVILYALDGEANRDLPIRLLIIPPALQVIMRGTELHPSVRSLASRVLLSLSLSLPAMSRSSLSQDVHLLSLVHARLSGICLELAQGTTSAMGRSLGLVLKSTATEGNEDVGNIYHFLSANVMALLIDHANKTQGATKS